MRIKKSIVLVTFLLSCRDKAAKLTDEEISSKVTSQQIEYLKLITSKKDLDDSTTLLYLDSIESTNRELAETPDSIDQILALIYNENSEAFATIPNRLRITRWSNFSNDTIIDQSFVSVNFKLKNAKRTLHISDSTSKFFIALPPLRRNALSLKKYIPCINYEGYESAFTPPIFEGIGFNNNSDTVKVYYISNYSGFILTIVKGDTGYRIADLISEGDF